MSLIIQQHVHCSELAAPVNQAGLLIADVVGAGVLAMGYLEQTYSEQKGWVVVRWPSSSCSSGQAVAQLGWMVAIPAIFLMLAACLE